MPNEEVILVEDQQQYHYQGQYQHQQHQQHESGHESSPDFLAGSAAAAADINAATPSGRDYRCQKCCPYYWGFVGLNCEYIKLLSSIYSSEALHKVILQAKAILQ